MSTTNLCLECGEPPDICACDVPYDDEFDDEGGDCFWCGGEGWDECDDPIQCTSQHEIIEDEAGEYLGQICRCLSCGGSGRAKDMTIW